MDREQVSNSTKYDRYPRIFKAVQRATNGDSLRILSFGCSTGEEPRTLAELYFPRSQIIGMDVSADAVATAKVNTAHLPNVNILLSGPDSLAEHAPYDVIFAMSVLCRWPIAKRMDDLSQLFPFARFEASVAALIEQVKPGGLLVTHNTSYSITQSRLIRFLDLILTARIDQPGQVTRFAPDGHKMVPGEIATDCIFRKREKPWADAPDIPLRIEHESGATLGTIWLPPIAAREQTAPAESVAYEPAAAEE